VFCWKFQEGFKKIAEFYAYFISGEKISKKFTLKKSKIYNSNSLMIKCKNGKAANSAG
jgi:hypothetical protein